MNKVVCVALALFLFACSRPEDHGWLGYVEGENALVAPPAAGWILSLNVARGAQVKPGDVLFTLDTTAQAAVRANALSQLAAALDATAAARADVVRTGKELVRQKGLVRIGGTPRSAVEQAQAAYDAAVAQLGQLNAQADAARATVANANYALSQRVVKALTAGRVEDIFFRPGEYAAAGAPVISILPPNNVYVRFFIPETDMTRVHVNAPVHIACDGCAPNLTAAITFVAAQSEFTPPVIYSVGNREKLVFRAEARDPALEDLRPGLPVTVTLAH